MGSFFNNLFFSQNEPATLNTSIPTTTTTHYIILLVYVGLLPIQMVLVHDILDLGPMEFM